jgi:hypothetical protein
MKNLPSSSNTLKAVEIQMPLPGFRVEVESPHDGWQKFHETTPSGRLRIVMVKKGVKRP